MSEQGVEKVSSAIISQTEHRPFVSAITPIQRKMAHEKTVPIAELQGIPEADRHALIGAKIDTVEKLIFCSQRRLVRAFGGNGNGGTRRSIRRINRFLHGEGFQRRMSKKQFQQRIAELRNALAQEH